MTSNAVEIENLSKTFISVKREALIILDIIFVIVGGLLFKRTERYVRKKGALSQF
ncbi:MAG: hypothetical protein KAU48_04560 [Candidatus Thorarchaeota archaeon]|nr:hypothetical protein [Candidatus Thorarchaeota archaeon]